MLVFHCYLDVWKLPVAGPKCGCVSWLLAPCPLVTSRSIVLHRHLNPWKRTHTTLPQKLVFFWIATKSNNGVPISSKIRSKESCHPCIAHIDRGTGEVLPRVDLRRPKTRSFRCVPHCRGSQATDVVYLFPCINV